MKRIAFLTLALVIGLLGTAQAQGVISFETESHDFGTVTEGEKPTYTFRFSNTGDQPLTITHVQPSCGCTAPSYSTDPVAPGGSGEIVVEYNSEGRPGEFNKTVSVQLDGTEASFVSLRITGSVTAVNIQNGVTQGSVMFDADTHMFGEVAAGASANHVFRMQNYGTAPVQITEARVFNDAVSVDFPQRMVFPSEIIDIEVAVSDVNLVLNHRGEMDVAIILTTDDAAQPTKSLRLRGRIQAVDSSARVIQTETQ